MAISSQSYKYRNCCFCTIVVLLVACFCATTSFPPIHNQRFARPSPQLLREQAKFWQTGDEDKFDKFNPFENSSRVSLRDQRMQEVNRQLINVANDNKALEAILNENREFLLEPLEDEQSAVAVGSVYDGCKDRSDRYRAYAASLDTRIAAARGAPVRKVLEALKEFVVSHE